MNDLADRREEEKERRRREILEAAERIAGESGFAALTMERVAAGARLSRALLYVYFKDRNDLMSALAEKALLSLHRRFAAAVRAGGTGYAQVMACGRAYVAFWREQRVEFDALAHFEAQQCAEPQDNALACFAAGDRVQAELVSAINAGMADGSLRSDLPDAGLVATNLWGFLHGNIVLATNKAAVLAHHGFSGEQVLDAAIELAGRSIAARPV
ncbi:MAG: helix-turn-helix domain-containing protein [Steroidobacteraceae bacterium]